MMLKRLSKGERRLTAWLYSSASLLVVSGGLTTGCEGRPDQLATWLGNESGGGSAFATGGELLSSGGGPYGGHSGGGGSSGGSAAADGGMGGATVLEPGPLALTGDLEVHDVTVVDDQGSFFLFQTGGLLKTKTSADLLHWESSGEVFDEMPAWIEELLPEVTGLWAPDVAYFGGMFHLYYAASTTGSGRSCIGHATKESIAELGSWTDRGAVICTDIGDENQPWDAIDPSVLVGPMGQVSLLTGSYGEGLKWLPLTDDGDWLGEEIQNVARRPSNGGAIQAGELVYHAPYYYLLASFGQCCIGVESTSTVRVGRALQPQGPYEDRDGVQMLDGGGTQLMEPDARLVATGGPEVFTVEGQDYIAYHAYDADALGQAVLRVVPIFWEEGWPEVQGP